MQDLEDLENNNYNVENNLDNPPTMALEAPPPATIDLAIT